MGVNFDGPSDDSPYAPKFYRSGWQRADAMVLNLAEGQQITGIDLVLTPLVRRDLHVRVTQPNGEPLAGAHIPIAHEHTHSFENLSYVSNHWATDADGNAYVHVFGDSRIRVWAEFSRLSADGAYVYQYSPVVEIEGRKLPGRLDLVVSAAEPHLAQF